MTGKLEIRVLGDFVVTRGGEPLSLPPSKKTRALLAYLAVVGRPQRRERLCELFWEIPDDPRGALRWSLSKLRHVLLSDGELLQADRNTVELRSSAFLDYAVVRSSLQQDVDALSTDRLETLATLFRGSFLDDLSLPRCPEYEAWRIAVADETELARIRILRTLVGRLAEQPAQALPHAHSLQALLPGDPDVERKVKQLASAARYAPATPAAEPVPTAAAPELPPPVPASPPSVASSSDAGSGADEVVRFCTTREGVRLAYAVSGTGPPIVKAANWMSHLRYDWQSPIWRHWVAGLSERNCLVRYDSRGNGLSDREVSDFSFEAQVADLESIADASGLGRFCLLGVSQGCAISIAYAVRHPERVSRLILYGGYFRGWRARGDAAEITRREALLGLMRQGWGQQDSTFRQIFTQMFVPGASQEAMDWFNELQRQSISPENAARLQESNSRIDVSALLPQVSVPTLVLHGLGDAVVPISEGRAMSAAIPGARFVPLDTRNHIMLAEEPAFAAFMSEVRAFASVEPDGATAKPQRLEFDTDRRQVTVLALEIVSPLQAFDQDDPEVFARHLDPLFGEVAATIERHFGTILSAADGALSAAFGAVRATEDHAYLACRAALAAKAVVDAQSGGTARLRAGIDTGEALVRRRDGSRSALEVIGAPPRIAAQLMRALRRAVLAATARARQAAGGYVRMERMPTDDLAHAIRGDRAYELLDENTALSRWHLRANQGLTTLIGRQIELDLLRQAWQRVREGTGRLVGIVGEPGVGKSRLTHEFLALPEVTGFTVHECGGLELDAGVSYHVVKKLLRAVCGIADAQPLPEAHDRLDRKVAEHGLDRRLVPPLAFVLDLPITDAEWLALDGSERRRRVRAAVRALLAAESRRTPIALLVEDLHWADTESVSVVRKIAESIAAHRILLLVTYRPEYSKPWLRDSDVQVINLQPLGRGESRALLDSILGADESLKDLKSVLIERSEGTPLFLEEWVRSLLESGQLVPAGDGYRIAGGVGPIQLPASVQSVIAARIGRLSEEDRSLLQVAAVIGTNVSLPLLAALVPHPPEALEAVLARLTESDFLFELQSFPTVEYTFKHALTQNVAYDSLTSDGRRMLHRRALMAMERLYPEALNDLAEKLADHAFRAEEWNAAANYLVQSADKAVDLSAYDKAARWLEQAVQAVDSLPDSTERDRRAIDVRTRMRPVYDATGSFGKAATRLQEAKHLAGGLDDLERLMQVLIHQSYLYSSHGRIEEALAAADELRHLARANAAERYVSEADLAAAQALLMRAEAAAALNHLEAHYERFTGVWRHDRFGLLGTRAVWYLGHYAFAKALLGDFEAADRAASQSAQIAEEVGRPFDILAARYCGALVEIVRGPTPEFVSAFRDVVQDRHTEAAATFRPWLSAVLGHAEYATGDYAAACETLERAAAEANTFDLPQFDAYARALCACACAKLPERQSAADLGSALELARHGQDRWVEVTVLRAMAEAASGEQRIAVLKRACMAAEQAGLRPEAAQVRLALGRVLADVDRKQAVEELETAAALFAASGLHQGHAAATEAIHALADGATAQSAERATT